MTPQEPGAASSSAPPTGTPGPTVGYCRSCGKALDAASLRSAQGTIYCADHVPAATNFAGAGTAGDGGYGSPYSSPYTSPYSSTTPPPLPNRDVSPGLAFLLGLIPGVGAVYNGQYGKGLVHVVIVGLLISVLSDNAAAGLEPLLSLLLAAFWAYMAFEAFHTAKRRRLGQPVDEFSSVLPVRGGPNFPAAPVIMIALGVVFLLSNLGLLEIRRMLRYWPVLLIALGVYLLYARLASATRGNQPPSAGAGGQAGDPSGTPSGGPA